MPIVKTKHLLEADLAGRDAVIADLKNYIEWLLARGDEMKSSGNLSKEMLFAIAGWNTASMEARRRLALINDTPAKQGEE